MKKLVKNQRFQRRRSSVPLWPELPNFIQKKSFFWSSKSAKNNWNAQNFLPKILVFYQFLSLNCFYWGIEFFLHLITMKNGKIIFGQNFWNSGHSGMYRKLLSYKALDEQLRKPVDCMQSRVVTTILGLWSLIHFTIIWFVLKSLLWNRREFWKWSKMAHLHSLKTKFQQS